MSGLWNDREIEDINRHFLVTTEKTGLTFPGKDIPESLLGARNFGKHPHTSLLPADLKIEKWKIQLLNRLKMAAASAGIFALACTLAAACHLFFLNRENLKLESEILKMGAEMREVKEMASSLNKIRKAEASKKKILDFMKEIAEKMPASAHVIELQIEDKCLIFKGEGPSHSVLSEAVQVFEGISILSEAKLERTRLRKRLNQDYLEFEVSAKWKD